MSNLLKADVIKSQICQEFKDSIDDINSYEIKISSQSNEDDQLEKVHYSIVKPEFDFHVSYVLDYDIDFTYSKEEFEIDAYNRLVSTIKKIQELANFFEKKNSKYRKLNVGDCFGFGYYQGVPLRWKVIKKQNNDLMVISDGIICKRRFHKDNSTNKWDSSEIRSWLNGEFFYNAFDEGERELIKTTHNMTQNCLDTDDKIFLLSKEEFGELLSAGNNSIRVNDWWWLRSPGGNNENAAVVLVGASSESEEIKSNVDNSKGAVCPVFWISC